jgi:hypothetical protein
MNNLPASLLKTVYKSLTEDDNLEIIRAYIISGGEAVTLSDFQLKIKDRCEFADEQIRQHVGVLNRNQINNIVRDKYSVTTETAYRYMKWAEELYASSSPLNKKAKILVRIEWCEKQAKNAIDAGNFSAAAIYEKVLCDYIDKFPDLKEERSKRTQIFVLPEAFARPDLTTDAAFEILVNAEQKKLDNE